MFHLVEKEALGVAVLHHVEREVEVAAEVEVQAEVPKEEEEVTVDPEAP